jgi:hypothetical protein
MVGMSAAVVTRACTAELWLHPDKKNEAAAGNRSKDAAD